MHGSRRIIRAAPGRGKRSYRQVINEQLQVAAKRRVVPTVEGFTSLEDAALAGAPENTVLEVVTEPTGAAWLPVAIWFTPRGHTVLPGVDQKGP